MLNTYQAAKGCDLLKKLACNISLFAVLSRIVVRKSKTFKPEVFLLALIKSSNQGKATLNKIAMEMCNIDNACDISPQALWKRLNREDCLLEQFISKCIALITSHGVVEASLHKAKFIRILTEDSSFVKILKACSDLFPAHGNKHGCTAGLKLNMIFDLLTGDTVELSTHAATTQDRTIGYDILKILRKGDLVLRDMGYFCVNLFNEIEGKCADWLSRAPSSINIYINESEEIEKLLKHSKSGLIDREVELTNERKAARLIAVKKKPCEANKAVRELRAAARKIGKNPSQKAILRAQWHILVTSISKKCMTAGEISRLYAQRWQIEIVFKAWKQSGKLEQALSNKSSYQLLLGIFLADVLRLALTMRYYSRQRRKSPGSARLSISKLSDWISTKISSSRSLSCLLKIHVPTRLTSTQKRKRKFQLISMLDLLG